MSRWRLAVRIARRTARRDRGRTVLVAALVAAPVLGTAFLDTAYRTASLTPATVAARELGTADASLLVTDFARIEPIGTTYNSSGDAAQRDAATVRPEALLPAGTRLLPRSTDSTVAFVTGDRTTLAPAGQLDWADPLAAGLLAVRSGRLAAAPGELTLSPSLADRLGARVGDDVRLADGSTHRVVGLAADPGCRSCQLAAGLPGWTGQPTPPGEQLVDLPAGTVADRALQDRLAAAGVFLLPRDAVLHPDRWQDPDLDTGSGDTAMLGIVVLVAGIGMLEVVLLAGTAFAVAARRQVRDAALVLANGGRPQDVRRMLLAQGAVLGVLGAAAGLALGVLAVLAAWGPLQRLTDQDFGALVVSPRDLAIAGVVGVLAGVAAAVVPAASAARVPVLAALAGRVGIPTRARRQVATGAVLLAVGGLVLAGLVAGGWAAARRSDGGAGLAYPLAMLAGFGVTMVALTVLAPSLVGLAGRVGGRLPLTGRLAVRDAARHRHRTGPAVGAVMVAVAGSVAVAFAVASYDQHDRDGYVPSLPNGWASVYLVTGQGYGTPADQLAAVRAAATELPGATVVPVPTPGARQDDGSRYVEWSPPAGNTCTAMYGGVAVGTPVARLVAGARADEAAAALAAGRAVVTNPCLVGPDGTAVLAVRDSADSALRTELRLPALVLPAEPGDTLPTGVVGEAAIGRAGLVARPTMVLLTTSRAPTAAEEDRARTVLGPLADQLRIERGYGSPYLPGFLALIGGAGLVTLAGVAVSVALSAAEGRADLATLAAIGAPPRRRRGLAMAQAGLIAGLGVGLGLALGAAIGLTIMSGLDGYPLVVPWLLVLSVGLAVPVLGVLAVGLCTRSRLPMVRRLA